MWNRNFNNLIASHFGLNYDGYNDGGTAVKDYEGLSYQYNPNYYQYYASYRHYYAFNKMPLYKLFTTSGTATEMASIIVPTLMVGSGTDEESYDDYTLKEISGQKHIAYVNTGVTFDSDTRTWSVEIKRVLRNNSGTPITVSEVGLFTYVNLAYSGTYANRPFMVQRKLLDKPITVENKAIYSVTMTLTYTDNYNQNDGTVRNFDNIIVSILKGSTTTGYADGFTSLKNASGTQVSTHYNALLCLMKGASSNYAPTSTGNSFLTLEGGSSNEPHSYEDYKVSSFSNQTHVSSTYWSPARYDAATHSWLRTVERTLINNSGAPITISEVGLYASLGASGTSINNSSNSPFWSTTNVLIQRRLLEDPLIVPDGAMYTISMDIRFTEQR